MSWTQISFSKLDEQIGSHLWKKVWIVGPQLRAADMMGDTVETWGYHMTRKLNDFFMNSAQKEAEQIVGAHQIITLSERDSRAFAKALAEPPAPSERARQAARDYLARYHE